MSLRVERALDKSRTASITVAPHGTNKYADYICAAATGNQSEINAAIAAAAAQPNGGVVYLRAGTYVMTSTITPASNVTLRGEGPSTVLRINADSYIIQNDSNNLTDFSLENITFEGDNTANHAKGAMFVDGDLDPNATTPPTISNITMFRCNVRNTTSLPIKIFGVGGKVMVTECEFSNCLDAGFIYDDEVIFANNHSYSSGDNGFSISRGCKKITCVGNTVEDPTFHGIWLGGFNGEAGPIELSCVGNTVKNARYSGIYLGGAPQKGVILGNYIDMNHNRPIDDNIFGIQIYGDNSSQFSQYFTVGSNTILNAARAGIGLYWLKDALISNNLIINPGTQYKADGTTVIDPSNTTTNIGVFLQTANTYSHVQVQDNYVIDNRATPYCNYDYYPVGTSGFTEVNFGINHSYGMRNPTQSTVTIGQSSGGAMDIGGFGSPIVVDKPQLLIGANTNNIAGAAIRNTNAGTTAESRFIMLDSTGHYIAMTCPGTGNSASNLFGASRSTTTFIFSNGGTARDMAIGTIASKSLILGTNNTERLRINSSGRIGVGVSSPTAQLHLPAGAAAANGAPLKLTPGTNLTTPEDGTFEYDGTHLYFTIGSTRNTII